MARPRIGICTAIERARWSYWDTEAYLLDRNYVDAVQAAGGIALMLPPDAEASTGSKGKAANESDIFGGP